MDLSPQIWFPVVTLIIGLFLKWPFDVLSERRADKRDRNKRLDQRLLDAELEQARFQRQTLLELQDTIFDFGRCVASAHSHDVTETRKGNLWHKIKLPEDLNEEFRLQQVAMYKFKARIRDDAVRTLCERMLKNGGDSVLAKTETESREALSEMLQVSHQLQESIGELLRGANVREIGLLDQLRRPL